MAQAADLEPRRRHPDTKVTPLRSTEPAPAGSSPGTAPWITQAFTVSPPATQPRAGTISTIDMQQNATETPGVRRPPEMAELDIKPSVASRLAEIAKQARLAQQQIDRLAALRQFADQEQSVYTGPAWDVTARRERDAIIQPPRPEIVPSRSVLQRAQSRAAQFDAEPEIG
jgi:hypothetical protein